MNQFHIVLIVFVSGISSRYYFETGNEKCPNGISKEQYYCSIREPCPSDTRCYRKNNEHFCCGELDRFCPTKMHAFHTMDRVFGSYLWGPAPNDKWYNAENGSEIIACPFPSAFAYSLLKELNVLPVDFDANKAGNSTPKACIKNSDCKTDNDEFCGAAYHPMFPQNLDRSGKDNAPLKFCYKFQQFGSTNLRPVITKKIELTGCLDNSDCSPYKGIETFCLVKEMRVLIAENNATFISKNGFCAYKQTKSRAYWWYLLGVSSVSTVICLGMSITFYILHCNSVLKETELAAKTETNTKSTVGPSGTEDI